MNRTQGRRTGRDSARGSASRHASRGSTFCPSVIHAVRRSVLGSHLHFGLLAFKPHGPEAGAAFCRSGPRRMPIPGREGPVIRYGRDSPSGRA